MSTGTATPKHLAQLEYCSGWTIQVPGDATKGLQLFMEWAADRDIHEALLLTVIEGLREDELKREHQIFTFRISSRSRFPVAKELYQAARDYINENI